MNSNTKRLLTRWFPRILVCVGLALIAFLIWQHGWRTLVSIIASADPLLMTVSIALIFGGYCIRAWKWRIGLGPGRDRIRLFFFAKVAASWTPGRVGEFAPLMVGEHRNTQVAAWILADRVLEVWSTVAAGLLGAMSLPERMSGWIPLASVAVTAGTVAGLAGIYWWPAPRASGHVGRVRKLLHALRAEFHLLGRKLPLLVLITVVTKAMDLWAIVALFRSLNHEVGFWLAGAARLAAALVSAAPLTPDSSGVPYVAVAVLLHEQAGIPYATLTAAISLEIIFVYATLHVCYLLVGGPWLGVRPGKEEPV